MSDQLSSGQIYMLNWLAYSNYPAASTVVFYDYFTNISREIEYIWKRPFSAVTVLFGINRFALLVWAVSNMPIYSSQATSAADCNANVEFDLYTNTILLYEFHKPASCAVRTQAIDSMPNQNMDNATVGSVTVACAAASALVDLFVIVLTWYRTHTINRLGCASRNPLADVLLRGGALYFFFQTPLTSIVMSHFLLNLREVAHATQGDASETGQTPANLVFNHASQYTDQSRLTSFVEPMGASLRYGEYDDDEDGEWDDEPSANPGPEEGDA
ncbi:hypothetical protein CERSUDRAFT_75521 [Gelatoporia subvermispora B]|uniref:DUF6533 domain-containing protein n=1 Tax=Ceriporiopsis subvermispora (strain B) TaxID=914234 RepID=M2R7A0_CERS8|nr:hypothetical protein CERSUDRAFT_75521 [Gelatoporia subvermispora B]